MAARWGFEEKEAAMANDGKTNFEIPAEMRAMAEKSMEQARQAFDGFASAAKHAVSTAESHAKDAQTNAKEAGALAMQFAERNIATSFDYAQKLVRAKDPQEVLALQSEYAKQQIAALTEQAKELGQKASKIAGQGSK
jgi:phasin